MTSRITLLLATINEKPNELKILHTITSPKLAFNIAEGIMFTKNHNLEKLC